MVNPSQLLKIKLLPSYPQSLKGTAGIAITNLNGVSTTKLDFATLAATSGIPDPATAFVAVLRTGTNLYEKARLDQIVFPVAGSWTQRGDANYTILNTDRTIGITPGFTAPRVWILPAASTVTAGTMIQIEDHAGGLTSVNTLTLNKTGADTINGGSSLVMASARQAIQLFSDGISAWNSPVPAVYAYASLASAATTDLGATVSANILVTGTTTITGFGTVAAGTTRDVRFAAALTLTHNATSLILPSGANIVTAAGDTLLAISLGAGNWVVARYQRASGLALVETQPGLVLLSAQTVSGSPATVDFTSLSATYDRFELDIDGVQPATDDAYLYLRVQTGGSVWQTTGYAYNNFLIGTGGTTHFTSTSEALTSQIGLIRSAVGSGVGNAANRTVSGRLRFNAASATQQRHFDGSTTQIRNDGVFMGSTIFGTWQSPLAITGVRLFWSTGNFANVGKVRLYGLRSS